MQVKENQDNFWSFRLRRKASERTDIMDYRYSKWIIEINNCTVFDTVAKSFWDNGSHSEWNLKTSQVEPSWTNQINDNYDPYGHRNIK